MRYIGNKETLVEFIFKSLIERGISGNSVFDLFSGTTNVGKFFKKKGYKIFSCDLMYYSYVLQQAYLVNNNVPTFTKLYSHLAIKDKDLFSTPLQNILNYLNDIKDQKGFIYHNYTPEGSINLSMPRMFYTGSNGIFIDKVRQKIEEWKNLHFINENEYFILLASLIETVPFYANISGVYAAFHKKWDNRALKDMYLREPEIITNSFSNYAFNQDSLTLLNKIEADIFYLDPPYNQRQYAPNYHLLETIAKYDDPEIKGVSGMRDYSNQKSKFCQAKTALLELEKIVNQGKYKHLALSYSSEGIMKKDEIIEILKAQGEVELVELDYLRFKSNSKGKNKKYIKEQLYILNR